MSSEVDTDSTFRGIRPPPTTHSLRHTSSSSNLSLSSKVARQLTIVQTPSNRIELQIQLSDLALPVQGEQVETTYTVDGTSDLVELPVPDDLVAACDADEESIDVRGWRLAEDASDPLLLVGSRTVAGDLWYY